MNTMELQGLRAKRESWIEALESGKYEQGYRQLVQHHGGAPHYCCLGVLVDVLDRWGDHDGGETSPMADIIEEYGLGEMTGPGADLRDDLINMNDVHRNTFTEIAAYLRRTWNIPA